MSERLSPIHRIGKPASDAAWRGRRWVIRSAQLQMLALDPQYSEAHRVRASIALEQGDLSAAKSHFDAYLAANPTDAEALHLRGVAAIHAEDYSDGVEF